MTRLVLASSNSHKLREIREILGGLPCDVVDLSAYPSVPAVEETGATFEANAILKAVTVSRCVDGWVLADDSGLEVDALNGAPGVRSARYAGERASDEENRRLLLVELERRSSLATDLTARFQCVLVLANQGKMVETASGVVDGHIVTQPAGSGGFGYDPLFVPDGYTETFAELPAVVKNRESHRARALAKMLPLLRARLGL